jgi:hypothetical protein
MAPDDTAVAAIAPTTWPKGYRLNVTIKLAGPKTTKYRRPYVVTWITDAKGKHVRTLSLWLRKRKTKYLNSLRVWWKIGKEQTGKIDTFSRATRNPGEYTLMWDGADDNGKALPAGKYTVHVECTREHGSHVYMHETIHCGTATAATKTIAGNKEVDAVKLVYGKQP